MRRLRLLLAVISAVVLIKAGAISGGQTPADKGTPDGYRKIDTSSPDVQSAVAFAVKDQRRKGLANTRLLAVVSAERQVVSGNNLRLCLSMDRSGRSEFARVVLAPNARKQWSLTLWAWGSCGR